jgi:CheY-like chemotaxis protein
LNEMLKALGYSDITTFRNGAECIKNLHLSPKLIFLDYQMEDMDGLKILERIKKNDPSTCVVFCTAYLNINVAIQAMKLGSSDCLLKEDATEEKVAAVIEGLYRNRAFADKIF